MTEPTELMPCPFCGAAAHFEMDEGRWEWVECESCGMQGNRSASLMEDCKPKLVEAWNRRTPAPVGVEPVEKFDNPLVQAVYAILCDDTDWPPKETPQQHWEGWIARRIVDQVLAMERVPQAGSVTADDLKQPRNGAQWRVEWWNESCRMLLPANKRLDSFQTYRNGTLMFTIKEKSGIKGGQHGADT